ncbi:nucleolar protein 58-like [Durio zibethinus]|uniref:Nucleolar protein 58-like n=1 Tax=Durio zibethinus TaxID=66656 RepID=A0A6P5X967_DURZI|nr:nucleolar protein 58-like [Durio zibethinus]XP_022724950.1 nucleolar protein 58-like [Durio zibethinus]
MDLETENRIAAILLKEAAELRRQADREAVHVYLQQPKVRGRPNSRFLTATVLGVQQANRAVEVNEMWRVRQKELELNDRLKGTSKNDSRHNRSHGDISNPSRSKSRRHESNVSASCLSSKRVAESYSREDEGLRDEAVEEFLQSRVKRGRGSIGSRMDETGPYLPTNSDSLEKLSTIPIAREHRVVLGPEKPFLLKSDESSDEELHEHRRKKEKGHCESSDKKHSRKQKSKEKSRDKKKKRKDEKRKHRK